MILILNIFTYICLKSNKHVMTILKCEVRGAKIVFRHWEWWLSGGYADIYGGSSARLPKFGMISEIFIQFMCSTSEGWLVSFWRPKVTVDFPYTYRKCTKTSVLHIFRANKYQTLILHAFTKTQTKYTKQLPE